MASAQLVETARGAVVAIHVPAGLPHIYSLQGLYLTRTAGQNRPLTTPELRLLLVERSETGYERQRVDGATLAALDQTRLDAFLDHIALAPDEAPLQALLARGCIAPVDGVQLGAAARAVDAADHRSGVTDHRSGDRRAADNRRESVAHDTRSARHQAGSGRLVRGPTGRLGCDP